MEFTQYYYYYEHGSDMTGYETSAKGQLDFK